MRHKVFIACSSIVFFFGFLFMSLPAESVSLDMLKLGGYIDLEYQKTSNTSSPLPSGNLYDNGSFHQRHFNLLMEAAVSERLTVKGHIEFEDGVDTGENKGSVLVEWAFMEFLITDYLKFRGGKIRAPYGFYNEIRDATPAFLFVEIPHAIYEPTVIGASSALMPKWFTGLNALGDVFITEDSFVNYNLYISNGENTSGVNDAVFDQNKDKAIGGRIQLHSSFSDIINTTLGFSFFNGDRGLPGASTSGERASYGVSASADIENFNITGEYFISKIIGLEEEAYFVHASYAFYIFQHRVTPYIAYSYLDPDDLSVISTDDYFKSIWAGLNVKIVDGFFFKFEHRWNIVGDYNDHSGIPDKSNDFKEIRAALVVAF